VACRYTDTWWEQDQPGQRHTQTGRCYTPADFRLLLEGTGLTLAAHRSRGPALEEPRVDRGADSLGSTRPPSGREDHQQLISALHETDRAEHAAIYRRYESELLE